MDPVISDPESIALSRAKQIFRFLKAFAERRSPAIFRLAEQPWHLLIRNMPNHESVVVGEVQLSSGPSDAEPTEGDAPLIRVRRPSISRVGSVPPALAEWLENGWDDPDKEISIRESRNIRGDDGHTTTVRFEDDQARVAALERWRTKRDAWAMAERPVRAAMRLFEQLFAIRARLTQDSERLELVLGDGRLLWRTQDTAVDHPLIIQRVDIEFDPAGPELRIVDAERSPELFAGALLGGTLAAADLNQLRIELEERGYHPLEKIATSAFCKRLVQQLHARGEFNPEFSQRSASDAPQISRDAALILRERQSGFAAAFERILADLANGAKLPTSLAHLTGIERSIEPNSAETVHYSPWGAPADVYFSKPANLEQVRIAEALDRHHAVLVQGPPGTGKSHSIANLIGHLLSQGKRVLITSHTTKALKVLRGHVVPELRPLCVAVLDNDLDGRTQMEEAIRGILSRLTDGSADSLDRRAQQLSERRNNLLRRLESWTQQIRLAREGEYSPLLVAGESTPPSDAARWITANQALGWIPGRVEPSAPLPMSEVEFRELYRTNIELLASDELELDAGLPQLVDLPTSATFRQMVETLNLVTEASDLPYWNGPPAESNIEALQTLAELSESFGADLRSHSGWHLNVVSAGYGGGSDSHVWETLCERILQAHAYWDSSRSLLIEHEPACDPGRQGDDTLTVVREVLALLETGGSLGTVTLLMRPRWKRVLTTVRVGVGAATRPEHFRAIEAHLVLTETRRAVARRWDQTAVPAGLSAVVAMGSPPEPILRDYAEQFPELLGWWGRKWPELWAGMQGAGFRWNGYRRTAGDRLEVSSPFKKDFELLTLGVPALVNNQLLLARRARAQRQLTELDSLLASGHGVTTERLRRAVRSRDADAYEDAHGELHRLNSKLVVLARRMTLIRTLEPVAPAWATGIRDRVGIHGEPEPPQRIEDAWRWRQIFQELERRSAGDESTLKQQLESAQRDLHDTTTDLVDARAWAGQIRRTDLAARQALQGWADVQRRIGKGTGKRVPQLQAEARKLLVQARDAVPVWIMPLARVAETMDPRRSRFDVVIIDEASQSDVTGLLAWYIADRVVVVGDHEQVSPMAVGQRIDDSNALIAEHLFGIPNDVLYDGKTSLYDLARRSFAGTIALREHFRCVPDIIEFSNHLSYAGDIRPLRDATHVTQPHVAECIALATMGSLRSGSRKTNEAEARLIVGLLAAATQHPAYGGKTFGVITLLGDEQGELIQRLALDVLGAIELEARRFQAGNAAQFQGDERDVMFLSMVDSPDGSRLRMVQDESTKQRYNVAASRARDQMWLVHSLDPDKDLQQGDLRRRLIEHVRNPRALAELIARAQSRAESPFEKAVIRDLVSAGYEVQAQVWIGRYRVDMVVRSRGAQVVVECDGDRFHDFDKLGDDLARQAVLERVGWRFVRIRGTRYFRDPTRTIEEVCASLAGLGVVPNRTSLRTTPTNEGPPLRDEIIRAAWTIMRTQGWLAEAPGSAA